MSWGYAMDNEAKFDIIEAMSINDYISAGKIAERLKISEKTFRARVKELNQELLINGAQIETKYSKGYRFNIFNLKQYEQWKNNLIQNSKSHIPTTVRERIQYILLLLLNNNIHIKREKIGKLLYISEKTISSDLKQIEYILKRYNLTLEKRPRYGVAIVGTEFSKRQCIMNHYMMNDRKYEKLDDKLNERIEIIGDCILDVIRREELSFTEISLKYLIDYIYISEQRIRNGFLIKDSIPNGISKEIYSMAERVMLSLEKQGILISTTEEEIYYLAIYLYGNKIIQAEYNGTTNFVIEQSIDNLTETILESIYMNYQVDMRNNFNVRMCLNKHLMAMEVRLKYYIKTQNPLLKEIKENYIFSYILAQQAGAILANHYDRNISEDEIAYLAMIFEVERLKIKNKIQKVNILLVCASGKVSTRFLFFSIKEKFSEYIDKIEFCNIYELEKQNLNSFDYIFSTVPIDISVEIPIIFIRDFMTKNEVLSVQKKMSERNINLINNFFKKYLFFENIKGNTKEEVIRNICNKVNKVKQLPKEFYQSVLYREEMGSTDFGNLVAIPHPYQRLLDEDLICVGILDKPILWGKNNVQIVILSSINNSETDQIHLFFETTAKLIDRIDLIDNILEKRTYECFCENFKRAY